MNLRAKFKGKHVSVMVDGVGEFRGLCDMEGDWITVDGTTIQLAYVATIREIDPDAVIR